jgi:hypothetical protein
MTTLTNESELIEAITAGVYGPSRSNPKSSVDMTPVTDGSYATLVRSGIWTERRPGENGERRCRPLSTGRDTSVFPRDANRTTSTDHSSSTRGRRSMPIGKRRSG